jgi:hypothetical protein
MPDNHYWSVGENLGKAWNIGKTLKKSDQSGRYHEDSSFKDMMAFGLVDAL